MLVCGLGKHSNVRGESPLKSLVRKSTKQFQTILAHKVVIHVIQKNILPLSLFQTI